MEKQPQFLKKFSKEYSLEERQQIAAEIISKRVEYFEQKQRIVEDIEELISKALKKQLETAEVVDRIKEIETTIAERKKSKILQILNYFEIKKLWKEVETKLEAKEQFEEEYQNIKNLTKPLVDQLQERKQSETAKNILSDFYKKQKEKWKEYEKDKKLRDVVNITQQYQTIFIHGINPTFTPYGNSLLGKKY